VCPHRYASVLGPPAAPEIHKYNQRGRESKRERERNINKYAKVLDSQLSL
jgi:hypothetical protein